MKNFKELLTLIPFVVSIAILLNLFVYQGLEVIYPEPQYEDYCGNSYDRMTEPARLEPDQAYSPEQVSEYQNSCVSDGGRYEEPRVLGELGYCDPDYTCRQEMESARELHALIAMSVLLIIGVLLLMMSSRVANSKAVELGMSYGGVFMLIGSFGKLWQVGSQSAQLIAIVLALGALLYFASKKLNLD